MKKNRTKSHKRNTDWSPSNQPHSSSISCIETISSSSSQSSSQSIKITSLIKKNSAYFILLFCSILFFLPFVNFFFNAKLYTNVNSQKRSEPSLLAYLGVIPVNIFEFFNVFIKICCGAPLEEAPFKIELNSYYFWNQIYSYMTNFYIIFISFIIYLLMEWYVNK